MSEGETSQTEATNLLIGYSRGARDGLDELFPVVYDELKRLARNYLNRERAGHTLQPTALVHEAYMRLIDQRAVDWQNRAQFFGIAARMMRRILINHAETRAAEKRGGDVTKVGLDAASSFFEKQELDVLALDDSLSRLALIDADQAKIVELKFFGGMTNEEAAEVTGVSLATVKREWSMAKAWLLRDLSNK